MEDYTLKITVYVLDAEGKLTEYLDITDFDIYENIEIAKETLRRLLRDFHKSCEGVITVGFILKGTSIVYGVRFVNEEFIEFDTKHLR